MLLRNRVFDLKSDVPKINTNVMQLFHGIFEKLGTVFGWNHHLS